MPASNAVSGAILGGVGPGTVFGDRFVLEREAGAGGMGIVWCARDRESSELVALKILKRRARDEIERFQREALLLSELRHASVVRYVAHGTTTAAEPWLAMEWIEGEDLEARLSREGLTIEESLDVTEKIGSALAVAHERGIVHRDVKPSNVILRGGRVSDPVLLDFGIAHAESMVRATQAGSVLGTLGYMAPEQARGDSSLDARADVFSLGCVLFECLTGRAAFVGENLMAVLAKVLVADVPRVRDLRASVPEAVDALVASMLAKEAERRPRDASIVRSALAAARLGGIFELGRATPSERPPSLTAGEQRLISVLAIASSSGAATAETLVADEVEGPLRRVAESCGARIEMLAGGSSIVMSTGIGSATDEAFRAARCAIAIRKLLPDARMALATGRARVGERLPVGEVIDRAAALLGSSSDAEVRVDEVTAGLLDARFDLGGDARGLSLRGERPAIAASRKLLGRDTPCVGRERELALLSGTYAECVEESVARAVVVVGAVGLGKSRLRFELVRHVRSRDDECEVVIARGDPIAGGSPFGMIAQLIRGTAGLLEGEPRAVSLQKLRARVARHVAPAQIPRVAAFLGELVDLPSDDVSIEVVAARQDAILMGDQMRRAFEDLLSAECDARPVLLVLEDLHWGDLPSVRFVDAALRALREKPLMVLALARPDVVELFPRLWAERSALQISLPELGKKASEKMVRAALGEDVPPATIADIIERGQGNAFYLEELVRAVSERRSGERGGEASALPETVLAMVQARLEELDPEARRVLRAASVFGQIFWPSSVAALLGGGARTAHVDQMIDTLVQREIISPRGEGKFPGHREYIFRHALVRDAAYQMLTDSDRVLGHRLAGLWLESVGERDARKLAEHFERGGEPSKAIAAYRRAAEQALEGNDYGVVLACVERALGSNPGGEVRGALCWLATEAHHWRGDFAEAEVRGREAMEHLRPGTALWYAALGKVAVAMGRRSGGERLVELVRSVIGPDAHHARTGEIAGAYVVAMSNVAAQLMYAGRYDLATAVLAQVEALAPETSAAGAAFAGWVHDARATRAMLDGSLEGCILEMQRAADAFTRAGDRRNACIQRGYIGYFLMEVGELQESERVLRMAWSEADHLGLQHTVASAKHNLGRVLGLLGRLDEALDAERAAVAIFHEQGDKRLEGASLRYLAHIHLLRRELDEAERQGRRAIEILVEFPPTRLAALATLAEILLTRGDLVEARICADEARDGLDRLGTIEEGEPLIRLMLAEALLASGDTESARAIVAVARDRLMAVAARISDESRRACMLESIPEHARILARARQLGA